MKNNRLKNLKSKMKDFFIRLKHKDTSFLIIALCVVLLSTAIVWRYTSNPNPEGNDIGQNENDNISANVDPDKESIEKIMEDYEEANKEKDDEEEEDNSKSPDLKSMKTPLAGEIYREFTMDELVYYEAIGEWRVHKGIDIKPQESLVIESALAGVIESVKESELTGTEIIIDHGNNIKTLYSNLVSASVKVGDKVEQGQPIGNIGKTASIESADGAHLHFELIVDGKNVNPKEYIN